MNRSGREVHLDVCVRMELQYDGTGLHGWAKQPGRPTVEGCLEEALMKATGTRPALRVAGRTDAGVHARGQVASLMLPGETDLVRLTGSLNALTPAGIAVKRLTEADMSFDARRDAIGRQYHYFVSTGKVASPFWRRYCWYVGPLFDSSLLQAAAEATQGQHDFTAFTPTETEHSSFMRTVQRCEWCKEPSEPDMLRLEISADAFLRHMVRTLVGTMVEVAQGKRDMTSYRRLLTGVGREVAGRTAPPQGLFLWEIEYGSGQGSGGDEEPQ